MAGFAARVVVRFAVARLVAALDLLAPVTFAPPVDVARAAFGGGVFADFARGAFAARFVAAP